MDIWYAFEVFARLAAVLLLFLGAALAARRWLGLAPNRRVQRLKVVESIRLAPRQALHLVRAGDQYLLVGATDNAIALVSTLTVAEEAAPAELTSEQGTQLLPGGLGELAGLKFNQVLKTFLTPGGKS